MTINSCRNASGPTLLLVEDLSDDVFFFKHALRRTGLSATVHVAQHGLEAVDYLTNQGKFEDSARHPRPDLVFLDLKMPNMNGLEVLEWVAQRQFDPPLRVVVLTGSEEPGDLNRARVLGAEAYHIKPPTPELLRSLIQTLTAAALHKTALDAVKG